MTKENMMTDADVELLRLCDLLERMATEPHRDFPEIDAMTDEDVTATGMAFVRAARESVRLRAALGKINDIRNSIVGRQRISWSDHIYPMVAALNEAGVEGLDYDDARTNERSVYARLQAEEEESVRLREENEALRLTLHVLSEHDPSWSDDFLRARAALIGVDATLRGEKP